MSAWTDFLKSLFDHHQICLVGPLLHRTHVPVMPTIYVDGGSDYRQPASSTESSLPLISVGDGDSTTGKLDEVLPAQKDYSDLAFVLRGLPQNILAVEMLGFLGGRRDHELANFGEVHAFLKTRTEFCRVEMHSADQSVIAFARGSLTIDIQGTFSVMVLEPSAVKIEGACDYPLSGDVTLPVASSHGLSNKGRGRVVITSDQPCFVFVPRTL